MIFYPTKETAEKFHIDLHKTFEEPQKSMNEKIQSQEQGDRLLEWGMKVLFFDHRKCIQMENFETKLTLFLVDLSVKDVPDIANKMGIYFIQLYQDDPDMIKALQNMYQQHPYVTYDKLVDRSSISTMNRCQSDFACDGYAFYNYFENNVLHTKDINYDVNFDWLVSDKEYIKNDCYFPGRRFREAVVKRFGQ